MEKREELKLNDKIKFDNKGGAVLGVLEGPVVDFLHPTRNDRLYDEELWEKTFSNPTFLELIKNGGIPGELDHPTDRDDICTEKVAVLMREIPKKDKSGIYIGKFDILDTPCGKIAYTLAKAGFKFGISSRGIIKLNPQILICRHAQTHIVIYIYIAGWFSRKEDHPAIFIPGYQK